MSEVVRVTLPNKDLKLGKVIDMALDSRYPSPKIDTLATPPHAGIIFLNWVDTTTIPDGTTKLLYSFPHGYNKAPTVFGSCKFDNGTTILKGTLPFQLGALGIILIDSDDKNINLKYYSIDIFSLVIPAFTMQVRFYVMAEHGIDPL